MVPPLPPKTPPHKSKTDGSLTQVIGSFVSFPCWSYCTSWLDLYLITLACLMLSMEAVIVTSLALVRYCEIVPSFYEPVPGSLLAPSSCSLGEQPHSLAATWGWGKTWEKEKQCPGELKLFAAQRVNFLDDISSSYHIFI